MSEPDFELFPKSIDEVWTENLYERLTAAGLIRHVVFKVWNKAQHRVLMPQNITEEGYKTYEKILAGEFGKTRREELSKFVFKVLNNRGIVQSKFTPLVTSPAGVSSLIWAGGKSTGCESQHSIERFANPSMIGQFGRSSPSHALARASSSCFSSRSSINLASISSSLFSAIFLTSRLGRFLSS